MKPFYTYKLFRFTFHTMKLPHVTHSVDTPNKPQKTFTEMEIIATNGSVTVYSNTSANYILTFRNVFLENERGEGFPYNGRWLMFGPVQ